jgi:formylglycine-generating enzyme required for sulfatase activity
MIRAGLGAALVLTSVGCGSEFSANGGGNDASASAEGAVSPVEAAAAPVDHLDVPVDTDAATTVTDAAHDVSSADSPSVTPITDASKDQAAESGTPCPGTAGPQAVRIGAYCIDSTEVTNHQYATFLANRDPSTDKQPDVCAWNTSYVPSQDWPVAAGRDNQPVAYVDWCDAFAFCRWAGKRMCGKIGGGALTFDQFDNPTDSQWYRACSKSGAYRFPYGQDYDSQACNIAAAGINHPVDVKELPGCQGGYPGIYDMVGNVEEWEDGCTGQTGAQDTCRSRGLSFKYGQATDGCALDDSDTRSATYPDLGIRCCGE